MGRASAQGARPLTSPAQRSLQASRGQSTGYVGGAAQSLGQWVRAAEDACRLAERHANDIARRLDGVIKDGERGLERGLNGR